MEYQDKVKANISIKNIGYAFIFTVSLYLICCFIFTVVMAFLKRSGLVSYAVVDGFYQATNGSGAGLIDFYNIFNTARWAYLGFFKEYPITTGMVSLIIAVVLIWMCSAGGAAAFKELSGGESGQLDQEEIKTKGISKDEPTKYDSSYRNYIDKMTSEINNLKVMWDTGYLDTNSFKNWYKNFKALENEFRERYSVSDKVSWIFLELSQLESSLGDLEKTQKTYQKRVSEDAPSDLAEGLKTLLKQHENFVSQVIAQAIAYCQMLKEEEGG